jgi:hypothetical protein
VCQEAGNEAPISCSPKSFPENYRRDSSRAAATAFLDDFDQQLKGTAALPNSKSVLPPSPFAVAWAAFRQHFVGKQQQQQQQESSTSDMTMYGMELDSASQHHHQQREPQERRHVHGFDNHTSVEDLVAAAAPLKAAGSSSMQKTCLMRSHDRSGFSGTACTSGRLLSGSSTSNQRDNDRALLGTSSAREEGLIIVENISASTGVLSGGVDSIGCQEVPDSAKAADSSHSSHRANTRSDVKDHGVSEAGGGGWVSEEGEFVSVMSVVTPCRSDKSVQGAQE